MLKEGLISVDNGTKLAESILSDMKIVNALITSDEKNKVLLIRQITSQLTALDAIGQVGFLRSLFQNLSVEGDETVTNRRDAALAILVEARTSGARLTEVATFLAENNPDTLYRLYVESVQKQNRSNDPFCGSVYALLELGKAYAPYVPHGGKKKKQLTAAWENVRNQFSRVDTHDEELQILSELEEIKVRMSPDALLDIKVENLRNLGFTNPQIAEELGKKLKIIESSVNRLIVAKRTRKFTKGTQILESFTMKINSTNDDKIRKMRMRKSKDDLVHLDSQVMELRKKGLSIRKIAEQLDTTYGSIFGSIRRLQNRN